MTLAIFGTSNKTFEKRIPIHPQHLIKLPEHILSQLAFEENYASDFGFDINTIKDKVFGIFPREKLFELFDILMLPKFSEADNDNFRNGQTIYGWPHCVQGDSVTQTAINKKLTLIAFEAMFSGEGTPKHHIFHKNNEMAGFAAIQHSTELRGITGYYGGLMKAVVFGFGSTGRGAIHALLAQGISDITVFTRRPPYLVQQQIPGVKFEQYFVSDGIALRANGETIASGLLDIDIIANCILQDPNNPIDFVAKGDNQFLKDNAIIADVSCDEAMGFYFARPTTFLEPGFIVDGSNCYYYSVDHTPSYFWNSSSYELSLSIIPFLENMIIEKGYKENNILHNALEIESGIIINDSILKFQNRERDYPHYVLPS